MNEINSINDLVNILNDLGAVDTQKTRLFRGQADQAWDLLPGIYRKDKSNLILHEDKIIKDALINCPDDFSPSDTLFEKLVKLQHYGYRTRLLDLTANALVALYFACWNSRHYDKDGELIVLDIPNEQVKYSDSDTVAILAALSLSDGRFNLLETKNLAENEGEVKFNKKALDEIRMSEERSRTKERVERELGTTLNISGSLAEKEEEILWAFNQQKEIVSLLHTVRDDKPSFRPVIDAEDLSKVLCVRAKMNNARISRQQGCFLIYGIGDNKSIPAEIPNSWQKKSSNGSKFIIKAESKARIIEELKSFGISTRILFPELEKQAEEIMSQYMDKTA